MRTLDDCKEAWIPEQKRLEQDLGRDLAGPFLGFAPSSFSCTNGLLYVGKATEGEFKSDITKLCTVQSQAKLAQEIFEDKNRRNNPATFWGFAACASRAIQPSAENLCNLAWSNICKVGEIKGEPTEELIDTQHSLAIETLRAEIAELKPSIILFVCEGVGDRVIGDLYGDSAQSEWLRSEDEDCFGVSDVWWRSRSRTLPAAVWMRHPQGSKPEIRTFALLKLASLL